MKTTKKNNSEKKQIPLCDNCENDPQKATWWCEFCYAYFCEECNTKAHSLKVTSSHSRITLREKALNRNLSNCSQHNEDMKIYCKDCEIFLCSECAVDTHQGHKTTTLQKFADAKRNELKQCLTPFQNIQIIDQMETYLRESKRCNLSEITRLETEISEHEERIRELQEKIKSDESTLISITEKKEKCRISQLIFEKSIEELGITSSLMNPEHISLFKSRVEHILKEVYPEYQENIILKLDQPTIKLTLDPSTIIGDLTTKEDFLLKSYAGHSCISTTQSFTKGINIYKLQLTRRVQNKENQDWLMIGVLNRPKATDASSYQDNHCYGVVVNTTDNNYEYTGGGNANNYKFRITIGDILTVTLNLETHKLITQHKKWESHIDLPTEVTEWYPHFNVHSLLFKLI